MISEIQLIPIEQLEHHPENPRFDLGDLTELTASIKANGILQNLTVVLEPGHSMTPEEWSKLSDEYSRKPTEELRQLMNSKKIPDRYLVVIGNRRLEAAKAAGLTELPCSIRDMDHNEQIATMLQENMQRSDLTVYEQAKGIQMMMNLGFTKDQISEKTGFSKTTIERRLAVASLPDKETQEAVECGWDLTDLVEISKIEDPEKQKELLIDTSPGNLKQAIEVAKKDQVRDRNKKRLMPEIEHLKMKPLKYDSDRWSSKYDEIPRTRVRLDDDLSEIKIPDEYKNKNIYYWIAWSEIEFYVASKREKHIKSEQEIALEKKQHDAKELNDRMRERRIAFLSTFTPTKKLTAQLQENMWDWVFGWKSTYNNGSFYTSYHNWDEVKFRQMCGMPKEEERDKNESILDEIRRRNIPMGRAIICWMLCGGIKCDDRRGYASEYNGCYQKEQDMDDVYEILLSAGYEMSEEEQQWKYGTHPFYGPKDEPDSEDPEEEDDG